MGGTLRVDPEHLRTAAAAQAKVGTFVSGMATGQSMASAGTGMAGLLSEGACQFAGTAFDTAASAVHDELAAHTTNLSAAADLYHQTDEDFGRRLRKLTQ
jgi:excreted virulence factor EspC (type VII ESX diderm)